MKVAWRVKMSCYGKGGVSMVGWGRGGLGRVREGCEELVGGRGIGAREGGRTRLGPLHRPIYPYRIRNLARRGGRTLAAFDRHELRQLLLLYFVDGGLVQKDIHGAEIDVQPKRQWVRLDRLRGEMPLEEGGAVVDGFDEGVVTVPEAGVGIVVGSVGLGRRVRGEDPDMRVTKATEGRDKDNAGVGGERGGGGAGGEGGEERHGRRDELGAEVAGGGKGYVDLEGELVRLRSM